MRAACCTALQLMYFMCTSTTPEWRKQHEFDVIVRYYEALMATGNVTGYTSPGPSRTQPS